MNSKILLVILTISLFVFAVGCYQKTDKDMESKEDYEFKLFLPGEKNLLKNGEVIKIVIENCNIAEGKGIGQLNTKLKYYTDSPEFTHVLEGEIRYKREKYITPQHAILSPSCEFSMGFNCKSYEINDDSIIIDVENGCGQDVIINGLEVQSYDDTNKTCEVVGI